MAHKRRHHASKRARMSEHMGMERYERGPVKHNSPMTIDHMKDQFNDEFRNDKDGEPFGRYVYDREASDPRSLEISAHRRAGMLGAEMYAGMNPRRRQEMEDAGMIHEDHTQVANLPQGVVMKPYPRNAGYLPEELDDTLRGITRQMDYDNGKKMKHFYPKKV